MKYDLHMEVIDMTQKDNRVLPLCHGVIPGSRPYHHTIVAGSETVFAANTGYYHILILIGGEADFVCNGETVRFDERVTYVPGADQELTVKALTDVQILEIQWDIFPEDTDMLKEYGTKFPHYVLYRNSIQYIDPNKSEKTISRMMIPTRSSPASRWARLSRSATTWFVLTAIPCSTSSSSASPRTTWRSSSTTTRSP